MWRQQDPDGRGGCGQRGGAEKRASPSDGCEQQRDREDHESRSEQNRTTVETLRQVQARTGEHAGDVAGSGHEARASAQANEDLPKQEMPVAGGHP